jgi:hypothetical protein
MAQAENGARAESAPAWVAIAGFVVAVGGLVIALAGGALSVYQWWNSEVNTRINGAVEVSTKHIQDSGLERIRSDYLDWFYGKVTDDNVDQKRTAALIYMLYLEYVAQLINSKRIHEDYVSLQLKCELINVYRNLYREQNKDLPSPDKIVNLVGFYQRHKDMNCQLRAPPTTK